MICDFPLNNADVLTSHMYDQYHVVVVTSYGSIGTVPSMPLVFSQLTCIQVVSDALLQHEIGISTFKRKTYFHNPEWNSKPYDYRAGILRQSHTLNHE